MAEDLPYIHLTTKKWGVTQSPEDPPGYHWLVVLLTATSTLPLAELDIIKERILKEGLKIYVTSTFENEMLLAMRIALLRAEEARDQNRTRAEHFEGELRRANERIQELETELAKKKKILASLDRALR